MDFLEHNIRKGNFTLKGEQFSRKTKVGEKLARMREESRREERKRRERRLRAVLLRWSVAAVVVVAVGAGAYRFAGVSQITGAVPLEWALPDGSNVTLAEHSSLAYNRIAWMWKRRLRLEGGASFRVAHGRTFTVSTDAGSVSVLGTVFRIQQQGKEMVVDCVEGTVRVETPVGQQTLNAGETVRCDETQITSLTEYPEMLGYEDDPLVNVVADIEKIFHLEIVGSERCKDLTYSGTLSTRDLDATLKKVFGAAGISYRRDGQKVVLR